MSETTWFVWRTSWLCARFLAVISLFLSQFSPKKSRSMSKRGQEQNFAEGSAVTEQKSMSSDQTNNFGVWSVHGSSRRGAGSDFNIVLSKSVSPGRVMRMSTAVIQSLRQEKNWLNWTRLTMSDTPKWKYRKMFRALKLKNEIELFLPTTASDNGQRNRWVRQTSKRSS